MMHYTLHIIHYTAIRFLYSIQSTITDLLSLNVITDNRSSNSLHRVFIPEFVGCLWQSRGGFSLDWVPTIGNPSLC